VTVGLLHTAATRRVWHAIVAETRFDVTPAFCRGHLDGDAVVRGVVAAGDRAAL